MRIAIIGGGVAGLAAGWRLAPIHDVTLYEAEKRIGGHALTLDVPATADGRGDPWPVDIGFQLWHPGINPVLAATTRALGVTPRPLEFHIASEAALGDRPPVRWTNTGRAEGVAPAVKADVERFAAAGPALFGDPRASLGEALRAQGFGEPFVRTCLLPLLSFWWVARTGLLDVPAVVVGGLLGAGTLSLTRPTTWYGIEGGSRATCAALAAGFTDRLRLGAPVTRIERTKAGAVVRTADGAGTYDQIVLAVDGATALALLADPTDAERAVLGGVRMLPSTLWVHRDARVMPTDRGAWCYGNYVERRAGVDPAPGDLRGLMTYAPPPPPGADPIFVTVADETPPVPEDQILFRKRWQHMIVDRSLFARRFGPIQGRNRVWYCGGHTVGFPIHELALLSGLVVADALGGPFPFADGPARAAFDRMRGRILPPDAPSALGSTP